MENLFTPRMEKRLREFLRGPTLLAFDFDGTLAPIVPKPDAAALGATTAKLLGKLCAAAPVAVLSGRAARDVRARVPFPLVACIGNHGMEGVKGHEAMAREAARATALWKKELAAGLADTRGLLTEDKKYSLTVHYRASRDREQAKAKILTTAEALVPPARILPGKCVVNILLPQAPHKGSALQALMSQGGYERAFFAGDDDTDEDVFRMQDPRIFSLRVGRSEGSSAQAFVESQKDMRRVLALVLEATSEPLA